ncbi:tRNA lysidine(34) synthetase TilS [Polluticoccus soli]|uniref:tRNA lysidine(34) synthetase TilS n=1 Tax=Polluticoccus soli TaxID=3034150 RepID=UPI0023E2FF51|nr:tRNA lysidine(34) synthetase TilS [Flavipsychrobacter sp. JY13-12]
MELLTAFQKNWIEKKFVTNGKPVLLAVSGGIDSMVMASLFHRANIPFAIAHCNFRLRGVEADKDEQLVSGWAQQNNIPFHSVGFDTQQRADEWKKGIQETARILRYEWLDQVREEYGYSVLATAHHANDSVETLLMNLFKGTGIAGLHGIPEKNGSIVRPLLFATRQQITQYAADNNISYRDDASNASDDYLRNAVRHKLVPVAEELFPNAIDKVSESITRFSQAEQLYQRAIEQERKKLIEKRGRDHYIPILKLIHREPLGTICYELFKPFGYTPQQIPQVIDLCSSESGHFIDSPTHRVIKNRDFLIITVKETAAADLIIVEGFPCTIETDSGRFNFSVIKTPQSIPADNNIAYIDAHKLTLPATLRRWKQGDYFYPLGMGMKKKKLAKFFIDQKIPVHQKERLWVLECDKRIAWIAGMRLDERFKVKNETSQVIKIEFTPL